MSSRRCDAHTKRVSNSFSIEALIAKDRKYEQEQEKEEEEDVVLSRNNLEEERTEGKAGNRGQSSNVELEVERLNRPHPSESKSTSPARKLAPRDDDDDDDDGGGSESLRQSSPEGRRDYVTPTVPDHNKHHHHHHHFQQQRYQQHLQQFQQLLSRPVQSMMESVHPLIRQNVLAASHHSSSDAALRRPSGTSVANPLFCCPPVPQGPPSCPGVVSQAHQQRPGGSREDELVPFYSWLLSRHGAFFNHRIHPAGNLNIATDRY